MKVGDSVNRGGVTVGPENELRLYGDVRDSYGLSKSIRVNKFSRFRFSFTEIERTQGVGVCFFRDFDSFLVEETTYCFILRGGTLSHQSRYVMVSSQSTILEGRSLNLALKKPTKQSSVTGQMSAKAPGDSEFAVDGNINQIFSNDAWQFNSVTRTEAEVHPFWEVDLEEDRIIRHIVIYKRLDIYDDDLKDFTITIHDSNGTETAIETINGTADMKSTYEFDSVIGRSINIVLNGNHRRILCLAEVQIYGSLFEFDVPIGKLFNLPQSNINRIAILQDRDENSKQNFDLDHESSIFTRMSFSEDDQRDSPHSVVSI